MLWSFRAREAFAPVVLHLTRLLSVPFGILSWCSPDVLAQAAPAIPLSRAKEVFAHAKRLAEADGGKLWGVSLDGPLVLVDRASRLVVANRAAKEAALRAEDGVWVGTLPANVPIANAATEWAGTRWTMVQWSSLASSSYERGRLLMHESFHRVQPELGFAGASPMNAHLETEAGRTWLRLELHALAEALVRSGSERRRAALDALAFRAARAAAVGRAAMADEAALEANEGIAEYTGLLLSGLPRGAVEQRAAVGAEERSASQSLARSFAYATGSALCLLLDEYANGWRRTASKSPDIAASLSRALEFTATPDPIAKARQLAGRYDGDTVQEEERDRARRIAARRAQIEKEFVTGRVLRIPTGSEFRYSFDPNASEPLDAERVVYTPFSASDAWGTLDAPAGAMLDFRAPMSLVLPIPEGATATSVPWKLTLAAGYELESSGEAPWRVVEKKR